MKRMYLLSAMALTLGLSIVSPAEAGVVTEYQGWDPGVWPDGPFPNSFATRDSFLTAASAFGTTSSHTFAAQTVGACSGYFSNGMVSWAYTGGTSCPRPGYSGVSEWQTGSPTDGFDIEGGKWLGIDGTGTLTLTFTNPSKSFGAFVSGLNDGSIRVTFTDDDGRTFRRSLDSLDGKAIG